MPRGSVHCATSALPMRPSMACDSIWLAEVIGARGGGWLVGLWFGASLRRIVLSKQGNYESQGCNFFAKANQFCFLLP